VQKKFKLPVLKINAKKIIILVQKSRNKIPQIPSPKPNFKKEKNQLGELKSLINFLLLIYFILLYYICLIVSLL